MERHHALSPNKRPLLCNATLRSQKHQKYILYIQLEEALFQGENEYISKVARTEKEILSLIDVGFEYVTEFEGAKIFRKRK